jgi:hypothetical protein
LFGTDCLKGDLGKPFGYNQRNIAMEGLVDSYYQSRAASPFGSFLSQQNTGGLPEYSPNNGSSFSAYRLPNSPQPAPPPPQDYRLQMAQVAQQQAAQKAKVQAMVARAQSHVTNPYQPQKLNATQSTGGRLPPALAGPGYVDNIGAPQTPGPLWALPMSHPQQQINRQLADKYGYQQQPSQYQQPMGMSMMPASYQSRAQVGGYQASPRPMNSTPATYPSNAPAQTQQPWWDGPVSHEPMRELERQAAYSATHPQRAMPNVTMNYQSPQIRY